MRKLATYESIIQNGRVRLTPSAEIPEETRVYVLVPDPETRPTMHVASPRLVHPEQAKDFELQVIEDPADISV